jgi:hypothetical protein
MLLSKQRRWIDARRTLEEARPLAQVMPYPYAEARTLYELGLMHLQADAPQRTRECLEEALAIFRRLGAQRYIEWTDGVLTELR